MLLALSLVGLRAVCYAISVVSRGSRVICYGISAIPCGCRTCSFAVVSALFYVGLVSFAIGIHLSCEGLVSFIVLSTLFYVNLGVTCCVTGVILFGSRVICYVINVVA